MAKIEKFLGRNFREDKVSRCSKMCEGKSKIEIRKIEQAMLKPEPISQYTGEELRYVMNGDFSAKIVFSSQEEMDFFDKFVHISRYVENCITDFQIILDLFEKMECGEISYDKKTRTFDFIKETICKDTVEETVVQENGDENTELHFEEEEEKKIENLPEKTIETKSARRFFRKQS